MSHPALESIAFGLQTSQQLVLMMMDGLKPEEFERQPCPGANCLAWIIGHLTLTDRRSLTVLGATAFPSLPEGFEALFTTTRTVAGTQSGFPESTLLLELFNSHRQALIERVQQFDPARLAEPSPVQRPLFSTYHEMLLFLGLHTSMHVGQISTIRRFLGYAPLI